LKRRKLIKTIIALSVFWLLTVGTTFELSRATQHSYLVIHRLIGELESIRTLFILRTPFLSSTTETMQDEISKVKQLLVELRVAQRTTIIRPDLEHLIRSADGYVNQLERLSHIQLDLHSFVEHLRQQRTKHAEDPMLKHDFEKIGAFVFEAFYSDDEKSKLIYRDLNRLYLKGTQLTAEQSTALNSSLAMANQILTDYARAEAIVQELILSETFKEKEMIEDQFHRWSILYNYIYASISMLSIIWFVIAWAHQRQSVVRAKDAHRHEVINIAHMANLLDNDEAAITELLDVFVHDHQFDVKKLKEALILSNQEGLIVAHSLKGVAASLGAELLRESAQQIETSLKNDVTPTEIQLEMLERQLFNAIEFARDYVINGPSDS
jgi:HPt (histidine-containing phosphotransfer) domain-containing protein